MPVVVAMLPNPGVEGVPSVGEHQESAENQDRILPRLVVLVPDHFDHVIVGEAELIERERVECVPVGPIRRRSPSTSCQAIPSQRLLQAFGKLCVGGGRPAR